MIKILTLILVAICLLVNGGSKISEYPEVKLPQLLPFPAKNPVGKHFDNSEDTKFINNRTDNDLVATYGTCYLNDFRYFTMLHQDTWYQLRWETMGNAVLEHRTWRNWPYEQLLTIYANGEKVSPKSFRVDEVEQQFDFRQVAVSASQVEIKRMDMMVSARQWITALQVTNPKETPTKITIEFDWKEKNSTDLNVRSWVDGIREGFVYSVVDGPPIIVVPGSRGTWKEKGDSVVCSRWELNLSAGETKTVDLNVYIGWTTIPEYRDKGPGETATDEQATIDFRADRQGFLNLLVSKGIDSFNTEWRDLQEICKMRREFLYSRMPRLEGVQSEWKGMWAYTFDLIRSGIYPAQGTFKDIWKVESLDVYREPFYWDGPASVHTFCNWDADIAARTLRTYLNATQEDGVLTVSANPYRAFPNPTPQLANVTMALWDCYQITQDEEMLASCYPLIVKHVRWLESERNRSPNGPLMDVGHNIDYGPKELFATPTIWPDVQFFLVDRYQRLAKIAKVINRPQEEIDEWKDRASRLADAIRKYMWDDKNGTFWCLTDKLKIKPIPSPIEFHGMVAGIPTQEQAQRLLVRLKDTAKYGSSAKYPYGLPSAPFDSPYFVVADNWSGTIWPIQTYYSVRGLVNYGYQEEATALSLNLYDMMARDYARSGSIWEQYDPRTGKNLSKGIERNSTPEVGRGYFTSGITTSVIDMLLRGYFGFERTDNPNAFYLTPTRLGDEWQGIKNLQLSGTTRLDIQMKDGGEKLLCKVKFSNSPEGIRWVTIHTYNPQGGTPKLVTSVKLNTDNEVLVNLQKFKEGRYLWTVG